MCAASFWPVVACLIAGHALVTILARLDAWRETNRQQRLLDESLARYEQMQHRWVDSPVVDTERRG